MALVEILSIIVIATIKMAVEDTTRNGPRHFLKSLAMIIATRWLDDGARAFVFIVATYDGFNVPGTPYRIRRSHLKMASNSQLNLFIFS